jgi:hypothetical protein
MRDPKRYTLGTAAKATGKSKTTIQRAISKGKISAEKDEAGRYSIDPSELHRVFPRMTHDTVSRDPNVDASRPHDETPELRAKIEALEAMLAREREALDEVRGDRDAWKQQATALLAAPQKSTRWRWPWMK